MHNWSKIPKRKLDSYSTICVVCGKESIIYSSRELIEPVDIKGRFIIDCNLKLYNTHEPNEISTAWRQLYSRVKNLGEENKVE